MGDYVNELTRIAEALEKMVESEKDLVALAYKRVAQEPSTATAPAPAYRWATYDEWYDEHRLLHNHMHCEIFAAARELAPAPDERKFNCPPFCGKCHTCHDKGPCPAPVPAKPEPVLPLCSDCWAKSADCAHGNLRGSQSCIDTIERMTKAKPEPVVMIGLKIGDNHTEALDLCADCQHRLAAAIEAARGKGK